MIDLEGNANTRKSLAFVAYLPTSIVYNLLVFDTFLDNDRVFLCIGEPSSVVKIKCDRLVRR